MNYLQIRHKLADFAKWKTGYDAHLPARQQAGLNEVKLLHNAADANDVVILFETADVAKAKAFCASDELRARMQELGVLGAPEILFLKD